MHIEEREMSTLKKIADVVGCSVATVSRAMNNCHDVSEQTRKRVIEVAKSLGYYERKKRIKIENRKKNEFNIAIICPEVESDYYASLIICFSRILSKDNHRTIIYNYAFDDKEQERLIEMCKDACNIDGIICLGKTKNNVNYRDVAMVRCAQQPGKYSMFSENNTGGIDEAIRSLGNKKGQSVLFVGEEKTGNRETDFFSVVKNYSNIKAKRFVSRERFERAGYEAAEYVASFEKLPSMIICAYDEIAYGLIEALSKKGISVPSDVSVIGINDIPSAKYCFGGLSSIAYELEDVCEKIVAELLENIKNGTSIHSAFSFPSKFIKRNT